MSNMTIDNTTPGPWYAAELSRAVAQVGADRLYETMVFHVEPAPDNNESCCPWRMKGGGALDFDGYNDAGDAYRGHMAMCAKWANGGATKAEAAAIAEIVEGMAWRREHLDAYTLDSTALMAHLNAEHGYTIPDKYLEGAPLAGWRTDGLPREHGEKHG